MSKGRNRLFGLGLIAGAALGYWLNTKEGKKTRRKVKKQANALGQKTTDYLEENTEVLKAKLTSIIEEGQQVVEQLTDQAKQFTSNTADKVEGQMESTTKSLKKGIAKAKAKIENISV